MANIEKFKFYAYKIMPLVYDESLSYYEFLCKVLKKLNESIDAINEQNDNIAAFSNEISNWEERTDAKYDTFVQNVNSLITAFENSEIEARRVFENQMLELQSDFEDNIVTPYDDLTYPVNIGDYCSYNGKFYKAKEDISTAGEWDSSKWEEIVLANDLKERQSNFEATINEEWEEFLESYTRLAGIVQFTGTSRTNVMSQAATTRAIDNVGNYVYTIEERWQNVPLTIDATGYYTIYQPAGAPYPTLQWHEDSNRRIGTIDNVAGDEVYKLTTWQRSAVVPAILYFGTYMDSENVFLGYENLGNGSSTTYETVDYEFNLITNPNFIPAVQGQDPANLGLVTTIIVQSMTTTEPSLSCLRPEYTAKSYTKQETDALIDNIPSKKYGVRWKIDDLNDLGERCFNAVGLNATIGIGAIDGESDFNNIYPWSEMKRCNIKTNANGAKIVTYEGETGFALDGSNGDVFVRIPKFNIERYIKDGYEYRVISESSGNTHEAFIEHGNNLDEIFVGAFEGFIDSGKLSSKSGVIPSSNIIASDFLSAATNNGEGYSLYDLRTVDALWSLIAIEFGCRNTNRIFGYGYANYQQPSESISRLQILETATSTNSVKVSLFTASDKSFMPIGSNITICHGTQFNIIAQRKITNIVDGNNYTEFYFDGEPIDVEMGDFIGSAACTTNFCESSPSGYMTSYHTGYPDCRPGFYDSGSMSFHNGDNVQNPVRYRWIENFIGSVWHFLPDVSFDGLQTYVCKDIDAYEFFKTSYPYIPVGSLMTEQSSNGNKSDITNANFWIDELKNDTFAKNIPLAKSYEQDVTSIKGFGGYYYMYNSNVAIANGGGFDHLWRCNILTNRAWINNTTKWFLYGARLIYKNTSGILPNYKYLEIKE